jgi:hypothetical protein
MLGRGGSVLDTTLAIVLNRIRILVRVSAIRPGMYRYCRFRSHAGHLSVLSSRDEILYRLRTVIGGASRLTDTADMEPGKNDKMLSVKYVTISDYILLNKNKNTDSV